MKNDKKTFILIEAVLAVLILVLAVIMISEKTQNNQYKISVVVPNSDDRQWSAFKYGLRMAAEDNHIEMSVASTSGTLIAEEQERLIRDEIQNGADAVIVYPVPGEETETMLEEIGKKVPVMLAGSSLTTDEKSKFPVTEPDHYTMGRALGEELIKDYEGKLDGKTLGIISESTDSAAVISRERGFRDELAGLNVRIRWAVGHPFTEGGEAFLEVQPAVDIIVALDDSSLTAAGECAAADGLHGACIYGIGNSTEAAYYLDTGVVECLLTADEFNVGYQSLNEIAKELNDYLYQMKNTKVSHTIIRKEELFTKENQEILFTMSQY